MALQMIPTILISCGLCECAGIFQSFVPLQCVLNIFLYFLRLRSGPDLHDVFI